MIVCACRPTCPCISCWKSFVYWAFLMAFGRGVVFFITILVHATLPPITLKATFMLLCLPLYSWH